MSPNQTRIINDAQDIIARTPQKNADVRVLKASAQLVLLNGKIFTRGDELEPKVKNLGAGVYQVWYESVK